MNTRLRTYFSWEKVWIAFLFLLGIILRLRQYLTGRSLWADEAMLALNIVNRSMGELFLPLGLDQGAPAGYLLIVKLLSLLFGRSEYVLRFFPFLAGVLSIWLFYLLLKRTTAGIGLLTALALFALNPRLIYYSSESKQYIVDVLATITLLLVASPLLEEKSQKRNFVWLALAGLIAIWFSHPAVFVLAGIGLTLLILYLHNREHTHIWYVIGTGIVWLAAIGLLYILFLSDLRQNAYMQQYWKDAFLPFPPWSDPGWFDRSLEENIGLQFGIPYAVYLVFALMLAGWFALWQAKRNYAITLGLIFLVTLAASSLGLYPVFERMILFLIPLGLILVGKSVEFLDQKLQRYRWAGRAAALALAFLLLYGPLAASASSFAAPKYFEHIRPAMQFLQETWREGDALFVSQGAVPAFEFYAPVYGLDGASYVSSRRQDYQYPQRIVEQFRQLEGEPRVWVLMSHVYESGDFNEKDYILEYLKQNGTRKREFRMPGTSVYLYLFDLGK